MDSVHTPSLNRVCKLFNVQSIRRWFNPFSANDKKWSNTQNICRQKPTNGLSVFDHFVGLTLKGLSFQKLWEEVKKTN